MNFSGSTDFLLRGVSTTTMRRIAWALGLIVSAQTASFAASTTGMCSADEEVVWECPMRMKAVALCASKGKPSPATTMQYRFGKPKKPELQYPANPQTADQFFVSSTGYSGGGEYHVRFNIAGHDYILFERTVRTGFGSDGLNYPAMSDGIVARYKGKVTVLNCSKAPDGSISGGYGELMSKEEFEPIDELAGDTR